MDNFFIKLNNDLTIIRFKTLLDGLRANHGLIPLASIENLERAIKQEMAAYIFKHYPELNHPDEVHYSGEQRCYFPVNEIFLN